jgi:hypothetical protein
MAKTMPVTGSSGLTGLGGLRLFGRPWRYAPAASTTRSAPSQAAGKTPRRDPQRVTSANDGQNQLAPAEAAPNYLPPPPMALFHFDATDLLFYGLPAGLLVIALGRSLKSSPKAALVYSAVLAAWLGHWAVQKYQPPGLPASLRIEAPDHLPVPLQITQVNGRSVLHQQAPAGLEWTLRGDERRLEFSYGLVPEAFERGPTDGCGFTVSLSREGVSRTIFHRLVRPRERPEDRGIQQASVILPPVVAGEILRLAVDVGPNGDNSWDWSLLCRVSFTRSHAFLPAQFPSFRRLPDAANSPHGSLFQNRHGPYHLQLAAPSVLEFVLHGGEPRVRFRYGFLPGAYREGRATDGARFVVLLRPAAGTERILWDRTLEPMTRLPDRGPQSADVPLGETAAGDRLIVRVEPGAAGDNSFDWTYVSSLSLE